jgi:hypothetical protein
MNPSILPLEMIHVEVRHEEMIREAAHQRLVNEARQAQPSKTNALQALRAFFAQSDRQEPVKAAPRPTTKTPAKAKPRTA